MIYNPVIELSTKVIINISQGAAALCCVGANVAVKVVETEFYHRYRVVVGMENCNRTADDNALAMTGNEF